jgi:hypothetical protein
VSSRRKRRHISPEEVAPGIAAGLTQGVPKDEALAMFPAKQASGIEVVKHMKDVEKVVGSRVPTPRFVGEESSTDMVMEFADGRRFADVRKTYQPEAIRAFQEGMICMKCLEPQAFPFEDQHLPGCEGVALAGEHYMRDRQIMDFAMEFEGERHIGPSKPIKEFMVEQEERVEKRHFIEKVLEGGQGKIPSDWLRDATLMEGLSPSQKRALGA